MGRLSTHILDTMHGGPAGGVALSLWRLEGGERQLVTRRVTNADGRTDQPLLAPDEISVGTYEIVFEIGAYFRVAGVKLPDPPFLDEVPIRFAIADPAGHYHVPLLCSPWSYSTYRGS